jgi:hypothetical protein
MKVNELKKAKGNILSKNRHLKIWEFINWLDDTRWSKEERRKSLIPGPIFEKQYTDQKILTHWLLYITDQQRSYEEVWLYGGPIFAEIVTKYTTKNISGFNILSSFTTPSEKKGGVDIFKSKIQSIDGEKIAYTPRYGIHILSIARTLYLLQAYKRNLCYFLSDKWKFINNAQKIGGDNRTSRIAFLLYLLTYNESEQGFVSLHGNIGRIERNIENYSYHFNKLINDDKELENSFKQWSKRHRYHKRLWAAVRDYLKPQSLFREYFVRSLRDIDNKAFANFVQNESGEITDSLELPGDIWNLRFIAKIFDGKIKTSEDLRNHYENIKQSSFFDKEFYPEQFDVSFNFSQSMCDETMETYCPFRAKSKIREYCLPLMGVPIKDRPCPITMITCGFTYYCNPEGCPVREGITDNLCPGCSIKISR